MYHIFFIHTSVDAHCFHVLAIVNSTAVNNEVHVSFQTMFFSRYMPRNGITGSYGNCIFIFLKNLYTGAFSLNKGISVFDSMLSKYLFFQLWNTIPAGWNILRMKSENLAKDDGNLFLPRFLLAYLYTSHLAV